ncbi:MAG: MFS transporter [Candidatus Hermodarchaeota archaeon]
MCYIVAMSFYRAQSTILLADFVQPHHRSKANSIINMMNALSIVVAAVISLFLIDIPGIGLQIAFITVSILMIISLIVLILTVNENEAYAYRLIIQKEEQAGEKIKEKKEKVSLSGSFKEVMAEKDKSTIIMLFVIFFMSVGWAALNTLLSSYGVNHLHLSRGQAGGLIIYGAITFLISAYPLAILAEKYGRRLLIKIGLSIFTSCLIIAFFYQNVIFLSIMIALIGIGYACVIVNTVVIIWELSPSEKSIGTYTGLYYVFFFSAEIFGPGLVGLMTDFTGWNYFLLNGALFMLISLILIFFVKRETAELTEEEKLAKQKAIQELK